MPRLRVKDNLKLPANSYRITSYDQVLFETELHSFDPEAYQEMINNVVEFCEKNYASIINKNIVKIMINSLNELYPGITDDIVPDKITHLQIQRKLQAIIRQGKTIRDFIHILEDMEEEISY